MRLFPTTRSPKRQPFEQQARQRQTLQVLVATLCILLILVFGVVQLLHTHDAHGTSEAAAPGCSLCAVAHLSALAVPVLSPAISIQLTFLIQQPVAAHAPPRFLASSLTIRPPPVLTSHS